MIEQTPTNTPHSFPGMESGIPVQKKSKRKIVIFAAALVVAILVIGLGYLGYIFASHRPDAVWKKFLVSQIIQKNTESKQHLNFSLAYTDTLNKQPLSASAEID